MQKVNSRDLNELSYYWAQDLQEWTSYQKKLQVISAKSK